MLSKICWSFDMKLADENLDWHEASEMFTLWKKPKLMVKLRMRGQE